MKKLLVIMIVMAVNVVAVEVHGYIQSTSTVKSISVPGIGAEEYTVSGADENRVVVSVSINQEVHNTIDMHLRVSNYLDSTFFEEYWVKYENRWGMNNVRVQLGTFDTYEGIFKQKYNILEQAPIIHYPSGVYKDSWMQGAMYNVLGGEVDYNIMVGPAILHFVYGVGVLRDTNNELLEQGTLHYSSSSTSIDIKNKRIDKYLIKLEGSNWSMFLNHNVGTVRVVNVAFPTDRRDVAYLLGTDSEYSYSIDRAGFEYIGTEWTIASEIIDTKFKNHSIGFDTDTHGGYIYAAYTKYEKFTPYASVSAAIEEETDGTEKEYLAGARYLITDKCAVIVEARRGGWLTTRTLDAFTKVKENSGGKWGEVMINSLALKVIYTF